MWKKIRKNYRRLIASLLTLAMVVTNAGGNLGTIFAAGETENALFLLEGRELREAIREAEEQGEVFDFSTLRLAAKRKSIKTRYEKLLGKKEGAVYALNLDIDDSYAPEGTELQVFYHAETEDVIFLFLNGSDMVVDYRVNIDGYETEPVRVNPNTVNIEADGENAPAYAENYEAADMIDDEGKKLGAEVLNPTEESREEEKGTGTGEIEGKDDTAEEETSEAVIGTEEQTGDDSQTGTNESETSEETEGTGAAAEENGNAGEETPEGKEEGGNGSEAESEAERVEETTAEAEGAAGEETEAAAQEEETEAASEEEADAEDGELLSISRHEAAIVAVSLDELDGGIEEETEALTEAEAESEEETEARTETENEAKTEDKTEAEAEPESKADESEAESESDPENKAEGNESGAESGNKPEESVSGSEAESKPEESEAGSEAESKPETSETGAEAESKPEESEAGSEVEGKPEENGAESSGNIEETDKSDSTEISDEKDSSAAPEPDIDADGNVGNDQIEMDGQLLEDDDIEVLGELKGKEYDTVTILDHVNARAWKIAREDIEEIIHREGMDYAVDYQVNVPDAATVEGADRIAEGENLYFAVEPESGYEIIRVLANGEELDEIEDRAELASESNWKGYPHLYVVEEAAEDLLIDIELEELAPIIPASVYTAETDDAVFAVNVPQGAFEEEVVLKVEKITEEGTVKELTDQAMAALKNGQIIAGVLAYDVAFISKDSGDEVEPMKAVEVSISYKETAVPEEIDKKAVTEISVVHLPENEDAEVVTSIEDVEETEFVFRADSFSPVVVVFGAEGSVEVDGKYYSSLQAAINSIEGDGDEAIRVRLLNDVTVDYVMSVGKSYTLDLNGHTLSSENEKWKAIYINGGKVVITSSDSEGHICAVDETATGGIKVYNGATLILQDGVNISKGNDSKGGGVHVAGKDTVFQMDGGTISGNNADYGGGVYNEGTFIINGGTIEDNKATNGGGIYIYTDSIFTMNGDSILQKNTASENGGGVYMYWNNEFKMNGGTILENSAKNGGGVYLYWSGTVFTMNSDTTNISGNTASDYGGGVYVGAGAKFTMSNGAIDNNENTRYYGGGVYNIGTFAMDGGRISNNKASGETYGRGGGVYNNSIFTMSGGSIEKNMVKSGGRNGNNYGGGIYSSGKKLDITGARISENVNGAICISADRNATAVFKNVAITENMGGESVVYAETIGSVTFEDCEINENNKNTEKDPSSYVIVMNGIVYEGDVEAGAEVQPKLLKNCRISGNISKNSTIYTKGSGNYHIDGCRITQNTAISGTGTGGIYKGNTGPFVISDTNIEDNTGKQVGAIRIRCSTNTDNRPVIIENTVIKNNHVMDKGESAAGGIYLHQGTLAFKSGALYNNDVEDFRSDEKKDTIYSLIAASKMKDPGDNSTEFNGYIWKEGEGGVSSDIIEDQGERHLIAESGETKPVAQIGENFYMTLQEAINDVNENEIIEFLAGKNGVSPDFRSQKIDIDKPVTILLSGCNIIAKDKNGILFNITGSGNLTLKGEASVDGTIVVDEDGSLSIDGSITSLVRKSGMYVTYPLNVDLKKGTFAVKGEIPEKTGTSLCVILGEGQFITAEEGFSIAGKVDIAIDNGTYTNLDKATASDKMDDVRLIQGYSSETAVSLINMKKPFSNRLVHVQAKDGNIVLNKEIFAQGIYLNGSVTALDDPGRDGTSPEKAVGTFEKAKALAIEKGYDTIYVTGAVKLNSEMTMDGEDLTLRRYPLGAFYSGALIRVENGANVILKDITLDGAYDSYGVKSQEALVNVLGGSLTIGEGAVLKNNAKHTSNKFEGGGGINISNRGSVTLDGGQILGNHANNGGGVFVSDNAVFTIKKGTIEGNIAEEFGEVSADNKPSGGGVVVVEQGKMMINGGKIYQNTAYIGGGVSLGRRGGNLTDDCPRLEMENGEIDSNTAESNGGGIYIQMNGIATVSGGNITNNHCRGVDTGSNFGGGGVYVNGGKQVGYKNGLLQLFNVEISNNHAKTINGSGAAVAGCPTADTKIYLTNGGVIYDNQGMDDLCLYSGDYGGYIGSGEFKISPFMLGGGAYHWTDENGKELPLNGGFVHVKDNSKPFRAKTAATKGSVTGLGRVKTRIIGNTSNGRGGALGSNGDIIIGTAPDETVELTIEKIWEDANYEKWRPDSVDIRILQSKDGQKYEDMGFVRLSKENNWKATVKDLPKQDEDGNEFIYKVSETPNGYDSTVTEKEGENSFVVTNTPTYALTLKKEVEGPASSDTFTFAITLSQADGSLFTGEVDTVKANGNQGQLSFENGEATVRLKEGESLQLKNLQPGMQYKIKEIDNGGAKDTSIMIDGNLVDAAEGSIRLGGNINVVTFTNIFEEEKPATGSLNIKKVVAGTAGEEQRPFRFRVSLDDQSISGRFGELNFEGGISEEFTLQDQQSKSITDLPAGIGYTVEELGAEELRAEAYEITFTEEGKDIVFAENKISGIIGEGESIRVICTNKKDKPDEPNTPDNPPGRPNRPGGGGGNPSGGDNPGGPGTTTTIETPDVPLAAFPNEPVMEVFEEAEVPLAALPKTGDNRQTRALMALFGIAGLGALFSALALHKRKED